MSIDETILKRLSDEHGEVHVLEACGVTIAVKNPTEASFERFMSTSAAKKERAHSALGQLVRDALVHPSADEYAKIIARRPGLNVTFGSEVAKIAGLVDEVTRGKAES